RPLLCLRQNRDQVRQPGIAAEEKRASQGQSSGNAGHELRRQHRALNLRRLVRRRYPANRKAEQSGSAAVKPKIAQLGLMTKSAPMKPTTTAIQRRQPTCSPKTIVESAVKIMGSVKKMPSESGIGITFSAVK